MFSLYQTLSWRYVRRRWFRALLIALSIALGVATLVATQALSETMYNATVQANNPLAGTADVIVTSAGGNLIDRELADRLKRIAGVDSAQPRLFAKVRLPNLGNRSALLIGIDVFAEDTADRPWKIHWREGVNLEMVRRLGRLQQRFLDEPQAALDPMKWDDVKDLAAAAWKIAPTLDIGSMWEMGWALLRGDVVVGLVGRQLQEEIGNVNKLIDLAANKGGQEDGEKTRLIQLGAVDADGPYAALGGNTIITDINSANYILGTRNKVSRIDIVVADGFTTEEVRKAIRERLPRGVTVTTPEEKNAMLQEVFAGMQTGFSLCGVAALVVGMFLVYNVLRFSVTERRHEIGILISLGATRGQIIGLFAGEAVVLGCIGALLGIPLGLGLAQFGLQPVQDVIRDIFMDLEAKQVEVSLAVLAVAVTAGVLTAVAAALVPALSASHENPAEAVRRVPPKPTWRLRTWQIVASSTLIGIGTVCVLLREMLPSRWGTFGGMMCVLLGALMLTPLLAAAIARCAQPLVRAVTGIEGRLAADNLVRSASRTGIVIAALAAGVALVMQTAGTIRSNNATIERWIEESIHADLVVTSGSPVSAGASGDVMAEELGDELRQVPGIEAVVPLKTARVRFRDKLIFLLAADFDRLGHFAKLRGYDIPAYQHLATSSNGLIVSENFSTLHHVRVGDTIEIDTPMQGKTAFRVVGTVEDYSWNLGSLFIDREDYVRLWGDRSVEMFDVFLDPKCKQPEAAVAATVAAGAAGEVWSPLIAAYPAATREGIAREIMQRYAADGLIVMTREELRDRILGMIRRIYSISMGQLIVVMCVAALGVVTALMISVLQRRRELGMLRAIGASQLQVVRCVLAEAALMGVIGTAIGLVVGVPMEWYVLNVIMREEFGYRFDLWIPWSESLLIAAAAIFLATLAGLGPALYAVRQRIPEAIAYE